MPDIDAALAHFQKLGFPVAWPIGRFWTWGRTCGVALGGINLELLQPDEPESSRASIRRLSFEPTSLDAACAGFDRLGVPYEVQEKIESDPALLRLRGWDEEASDRPQRLCTNVFPDRGRIAWDFFACEYAPFLRERLAPASFDVSHRVLAVVCGSSRGARRAADELSELGLEGGVEISFREADSDEVLEIHMEGGFLDVHDLGAGFRFV